MPTSAPNDLQPAFLANLDALGRAAPALAELVTRVLAVNGEDPRVFVSTDSNAHLYAGRDFLLRVVFSRTGELQVQPHTEKLIHADANKDQASAFFRGLVKLAMNHGGFPARWADLDRARDVLTLRGGVTAPFVDGLLEAIRAAPRSPAT